MCVHTCGVDENCVCVCLSMMRESVYVYVCIVCDVHSYCGQKMCVWLCVYFCMGLSVCVCVYVVWVFPCVIQCA